MCYYYDDILPTVQIMLLWQGGFFMRRFATILVIILICSLPLFVHAEQDGLYTYELNDDKTVTITDFDWANNHGDIYIPEMLGSRIVTAIGNEAFRNTGNEPVSITLPENIKSIGELAFAYVSIKYINIPLQTLEIGNGAFRRCSVMQFRVAEGHEKYATIDNALYNKSTKTLIAWPTNKDISPIPEGIKAIGDYVFDGRFISYADGEHFIPDSLTYIGKYAFAYAGFNGCLNNVSEIDDYAFYSSRIEKLGYHSMVLYDKELKLSRIGAHAFENREIDLKTGLVSNNTRLLNSKPYVVDDYAFCNCSFPGYGCDISIKNIKSIGAHAFENVDIEIAENDFDNLTYIGEHAFENGYLTGAAKISKVNTISSFSFYTEKKFTDLNSITTSASVKEIGEDAFSGQSELTHVSLGEGLNTIGSRAFKGCSRLSEISIPTTVTYIGQDVFADCSNTLVIIVEEGSYGEIWARSCGYSYKFNKTDDTSWLND